MPKSTKLFAIIILISSLVFIPAGPAFSQTGEAGGGAMIVDVLVARPLGFVALVAGSVFYVISYPFSSAGGNTDEALQKLVKEPADYIFDRPLGEI